jgi:hypothetical protein
MKDKIENPSERGKIQFGQDGLSNPGKNKLRITAKHTATKNTSFNFFIKFDIF